jgi:hypothetical protein
VLQYYGVRPINILSFTDKARKDCEVPFEIYARQLFGLPRTRSQRPSCRCLANQSDEFPPPNIKCHLPLQRPRSSCICGSCTTDYTDPATYPIVQALSRPALKAFGVI